MEKIISTKNQRVKNWKKLHTLKGRREQEAYLLEGPHLFREALDHQAEIMEVILTGESLDQEALEGLLEGISVFQVSEEVMQVVSQTETPQGVVCVVRKPHNDHFPVGTKGKIICLDQIQDPGNAGTIVRTADAAGYAAVVFGSGSVDLYNDKVLRSMQGSHFHIPVYQGEIEEIIEQYRLAGAPVYGTALTEKAVDFRQAPGSEDLVLIMGNEGSGVRRKLLEITDKNLYIPIKGKAESLNVAVAAGILMYHFV